MDIIVRSDDSLIGKSLQLLVESLARVERVDGLIRLHETANQSSTSKPMSFRSIEYSIAFWKQG